MKSKILLFSSLITYISFSQKITDLQQTYYSNTIPEADIVYRIGDIDNLGFGFPEGFNVFRGDTSPKHKYPWAIDGSNFEGTDRIMTGNMAENMYISKDGYSRTTKRVANKPTPLILEFPQPHVPIDRAILQIFVDDFQAPRLKSRFQVRLDGKRISYMEDVINSINQSGPVGKLINLALLPEDLHLLSDGKLSILIEDRETGFGDGYAIDFVQLIINPLYFKYNGTIKGVIKNMYSRPVVSADIIADNLLYTRTNHLGEYFLDSIPAGLTHLKIKKEGYYFDGEMIDLKHLQTQEMHFYLRKVGQLSTDIIKSELKRKGAIDINGIHFPSNSVIPTKNSMKAMYHILQAMNDLEDRTFTIAGHTDDIGGKGDNIELSERRAKYVKKWLVRKGVAEWRIITKGYGRLYPLVSNATREGRAINRRVQLMLN